MSIIKLEYVDYILIDKNTLKNHLLTSWLT